MQTSIIDKQKTNCLVFAAGWGMDPKPFSTIETGDYDVIMLYDYTSLEEISLTRLKKKYQKIHLIAWSMGVWVAAHVFAYKKSHFDSITAINGTLFPIDDLNGISRKDYNAVIDHFSTSSLEQFYKSMFTEQLQYKHFLKLKPERSQDSILQELVFLKHKYQEKGPAPDIYDTKIVGSRDKIFPARSQVRAWGRNHCQTINIPHFPFFQWQGFTLHGQQYPREGLQTGQ